MNGIPTEVVGVLPGAFRHPFPENARQPDVYVSFRLDRKANARGGHYLQAIGRLSAGASFSDARADLSTIAAALARSYPATNTGRGVTIVPLFDSITDAARTPMLILQGMVVFVLLIACANLANVLLARSTTRQKEIAVRQALGASRAQLVPSRSWISHRRCADVPNVSAARALSGRRRDSVLSATRRSAPSVARRPAWVPRVRTSSRCCCGKGCGQQPSDLASALPALQRSPACSPTSCLACRRPMSVCSQGRASCWLSRRLVLRIFRYGARPVSIR